jgi:3-methylfumaryl-CoA hydratase
MPRLLMPIDMHHLTQWIGASETCSETLAPFPANAMAATLDRHDPAYGEGAALPPLWHWMHFLPIHAMSESGPDGHAARGGFLPPVPLPRRMWAGSRLSFLKPLRIGETISRTSTVTSITGKEGRSGPLVFVTVRHVMTNGSEAAIEEEHDIVYREAPEPGAVTPQPPIAPAQTDWERCIDPDPVLLFRYSALTFNSHRIHYDRSYVTEVEGYPGLVVHGPLLATLLLDALAREHPERRVTRFSFRAVSPVFDTTLFLVCGKRSDDGRSAHLWIRHPDGSLAMDATAALS